ADVPLPVRGRGGAGPRRWSVLRERHVAVVQTPTAVAPELGRAEQVPALTPEHLAIVRPAALVDIAERHVASTAARRADGVVGKIAKPDRPSARANRIPAGR